MKTNELSPVGRFRKELKTALELYYHQRTLLENKKTVSEPLNSCPLH